MVYLTTSYEKKKLEKAKENKKAFDRFWLDLTKSKDRAKQIIKKYYQRVKEANGYFTTYKPGWKTDQGMVYIIFGPPEKVYRDGVAEVWHYPASKYMPKIKFSFRKIDNIFAPSHYVLIRNEKYRDSWFRKVELWRKGRI